MEKTSVRLVQPHPKEYEYLAWGSGIKKIPPLYRKTHNSSELPIPDSNMFLKDGLEIESSPQKSNNQLD